MSRVVGIESDLAAMVKQRLAAGASINELAAEAGIDHSQLVRWLNGDRDLRLATAAKLCEVLGLRLTPDKPKGKK